MFPGSMTVVDNVSCMRYLYLYCAHGNVYRCPLHARMCARIAPERPCGICISCSDIVIPDSCSVREIYGSSIRLFPFIFSHFTFILHILGGPGFLTRVRPESDPGPRDLRILIHKRHTISKIYSVNGFEDLQNDRNVVVIWHYQGTVTCSVYMHIYKG